MEHADRRELHSPEPGYSPSRFAGRVWRQAQAKSAYHDDNIVRVDSSNCLDMPPAVNPTDSLLRGTHQDGLHSQDAWGSGTPVTEPLGL